MLFVEQTKGGTLAKRLQQAEQDLGLKTGYKIRVVENAGTALEQIFPTINPSGNTECGRTECVVCGLKINRIVEKETSCMRTGALSAIVKQIK